jgi:hypothetical protein
MPKETERDLRGRVGAEASPTDDIDRIVKRQGFHNAHTALGGLVGQRRNRAGWPARPQGPHPAGSGLQRAPRRWSSGFPRYRRGSTKPLIDEALNLAYHGARAQDQTFNITLERDFADGIGPIELAPQDMTRVFLNLFGNGFYAATRRARKGAEAGFMPTLKVTTRDTGEAVEVRVRDNGRGIPDDIKDKPRNP